MKRLLIGIIGVLTVSGYAQNGQLPNVGFENWDTIVPYQNPAQWNQANIGIENTFRSTDAYHGNYALRLENFINSYGLIESPGINIGSPPDSTLVYTDTITQMHGYYKCNLENNEAAVIRVGSFNNGMVQFSSHSFTGDVNTWTYFSFPIVHSTPDSIIIYISSNISAQAFNEDSWLMIDSIAFSNVGGTTPQPIPNFSFEDWIDIEVINPVGWHSYNDLLSPFNNRSVFQSTDAYGGTYAAEIRTVNYYGNSLPDGAVLTLGPIQYGSSFSRFYAGAPYSAEPATISGYYKSTDSLPGEMHLEFFSGGVSQLLITEPLPQFIQFGNPAYSYFSRNINLPIQPDSIVLYFKTGETVGESLFLDDIKFSGGNVSVVKNTLADDWKIYPNPVADIVTIEVGVVEEPLFIEIMNVGGQVAQSTQVLPGRSDNVTMDVSGLAPGLYFYRVNGVSKGKVMVCR